LAGVPPDSIYTAETILTMTADAPQAFAVRDGRIIRSGAFGDLREQYPSAEVTDLGNAVVVPGFHDAHMHLASTADQLLQLDLAYPNIRSNSDVTERIRQEAITTAPGRWIIGARYDDGKMVEGRTVNRFDLDEVAPDHPIFVRHVAGH
jgi:predicted amidohydrolase YtcJ